jgi:BCD family chlorophyll transporter-like MFS transporter
MMALASQGRGQREGTRMGLWGAAQAIAAGFGGLAGAVAVDVMRGLMADGPAFGSVFAVEAAIFVAAALMAARIMERAPARDRTMVAAE